jgi:predicted transcriptional regulator
MANPELMDAVQHVTNELQGLRSAIGFNNISQSIKTCDGSQANLRNWLTEVEQFAYINRIDENATKLIA